MEWETPDAGVRNRRVRERWICPTISAEDCDWELYEALANACRFEPADSASK